MRGVPWGLCSRCYSAWIRDDRVGQRPESHQLKVASLQHTVLEDFSESGSRLCSTNRALAQAPADDTIAGCALPKALYSDALVTLGISICI